MTKTQPAHVDCDPVQSTRPARTLEPASSIYPLAVELDVRADVRGDLSTDLQDDLPDHVRYSLTRDDLADCSWPLVATARASVNGRSVGISASTLGEAVRALVRLVEATQPLDEATATALDEVGGGALVAAWDEHVRTMERRHVRCDAEEARAELARFEDVGIDPIEACEWIGAGVVSGDAAALRASGLSASDWSGYLEVYDHYADSLDPWKEPVSLPHPFEWASRGVPCWRAMAYHYYELRFTEAVEDWEPVVTGYGTPEERLRLYLDAGVTAAAAAKREITIAAGGEAAAAEVVTALKTTVAKYGGFGGRWRLP